MCLFLDEYVYLLADVEWAIRGFIELVDDLQDAGVDAFRAFAGEGFFGDDEWVDADKAQGDGLGGGAFEEGGGWGAGPDLRGILFIDVGAHLQHFHVSEDHEWLGRAGGSIFTFAQIELQDDAIPGGFDGQDVEFDRCLIELGFDGGEVRLSLGQSGLQVLHGKAFAIGFVFAGDFLAQQFLHSLPLIERIVTEGGLGGDAGLLHGQLGLQHGLFGGGFTGVELKQGLPGGDGGADIYHDSVDEAGFGGGDADVFA